MDFHHELKEDELVLEDDGHPDDDLGPEREDALVDVTVPTMPSAIMLTVSDHMALVPRLDDLVLKTLADNYHQYPALDRIPAEYVDNVVALLDPHKIDFTLAAKYITTEKFWKRLATERWSMCDLKDHGLSYKRLHIEKHVQHLLENYQSSRDGESLQELMKQLGAAYPFVHTIKVHQLLSHLELSRILCDFPNLSSLELKYGARKLGMDYDKARFGMLLTDIISLTTKFLPQASVLSRLTLSENLLTDELIEHLMSGLAANNTITHLDLSHNKIGNAGARRLCKLFTGNGVLVSLNLSDNYIRGEGVVAIAQALASTRTLQALNLRMNPVGDTAGAELLSSLTRNESLTVLDLACTDLKHESAAALLRALRLNGTLSQLDLYSNQVATGSLVDALAKNSTLTALDVRKNGLSEEAFQELQSLVQARMVAHKQTQRKIFQWSQGDAIC